MKLITEITDNEILGTGELSSAEPRYTARAILKNGNLYAVMYAKKFNLYSLPGGGVDDGEDIITALEREILEETGCTCGNIAELGMVKENRASADYTQCSYYFVVEADCVGTPQLTDAEKNNKTELQWHTLSDTIKLINDFQPKTYQQQYLKARDVAALNEYTSRVKWIFFDIGSTLVDESECYEIRYKETTNNTDVTYQEFKNKVIEFAATSDNPYKEALQFFGLQKTKWYTELEKPYPFTESILDKLSKRYTLGIIANQSAGSEQRLENWGIGKYFDLVIASAETGVEKPDPRIFEIALERANCLAEDAVMVGDRIDNDILPAKKLGMKTIWVKQSFATYQLDSYIPDYTVQTLKDIISVL